MTVIIWIVGILVYGSIGIVHARLMGWTKEFQTTFVVLWPISMAFQVLVIVFAPIIWVWKRLAGEKCESFFTFYSRCLRTDILDEMNRDTSYYDHMS